MTQRSAMRAPPQMWRPRTWRLACHGHSPSDDTAPPTMRPEGPCRPQSVGMGTEQAAMDRGDREKERPVRNRRNQMRKWGDREIGSQGGSWGNWYPTGRLVDTSLCTLPLALRCCEVGSPQCRSSEPSAQSGHPSHCGLGLFTQLRSSHWKVNVPQGTSEMEWGRVREIAQNVGV